MESPEVDYTGYEGLIEQARVDLAEKLKVEVQAIELERFELVVWPDGSLGCPQPGMAYAQVQREGYRILLRHQDRVFTYHGGEDQAPFLCLSPLTPPGYNPSP